MKDYELHPFEWEEKIEVQHDKKFPPMREWYQIYEEDQLWYATGNRGPREDLMETVYDELGFNIMVDEEKVTDDMDDEEWPLIAWTASDFGEGECFFLQRRDGAWCIRAQKTNPISRQKGDFEWYPCRELAAIDSDDTEMVSEAILREFPRTTSVFRVGDVLYAVREEHESGLLPPDTMKFRFMRPTAY